MKGQMKAYFQILDQPGIADIVEGTGASIVEGSVQTTNSWGLRAGTEPGHGGKSRGIVLGDSYMQGLFVADDETPTECLKRDLCSSARQRRGDPQHRPPGLFSRTVLLHPG